MPYDPVHPENSGVLYDESGKPYVLQGDGKGGYKRNYISPVAMGGQAPPDNTGIFHSKPQWNQNSGDWETPFDWGNLLTMGVGGALGVGAADAFLPGLFGGSAAASQVPAMQGGETLAANLGGASALPGLGAAGGLGAAAGGGLGSQVLDHLKNTVTGGNGFGVSDLLKLLGVGGAIGLSAAQNHGPAYPPELEEILKLQKQRMESQAPLYDSILKLSQSRLPISAQQGY